MDYPSISFTAVYLKSPHGYFAFLEELPGVSSQGGTIEEARANLRRVAVVALEEERALSAELLAGKDVVREELRAEPPLQRRGAA